MLKEQVFSIHIAPLHNQWVRRNVIKHLDYSSS